MRKVLCIAAFFLAVTLARSQEHSTCNDAIHVTTTTYGPVTPLGWADSSLCDATNKSMYLGKTHKVVWLYFIVPYDTLLTFDIVPEKRSDDFDFMLFKAAKGNFCQLETKRKVKPIRTNFSKPAKNSTGKTGIASSAAEAMVPPGDNAPYSSALNVKKGEWYYLVVDNYASTPSARGGFTLKLHFRFSEGVESISHIDAMPVKVGASNMMPLPLSVPNFFIHVLDSANKPIKANLVIDGIQKGKQVLADTDNYSLTIGKFKTITIKANAPGHMPYQSTYSTAGDTSAATFWIRLHPIKAKQKITLRDIQFQQDSPNILPSSRPALDYVLQFLLNNPRVKVIIKGYVNDPNHSWSKQFNQDLSEKRADAVRDYLFKHGVGYIRMKCIGYGATKMMYPDPVSEDQQAANRRVEIEIK